MSAKGNVVSGTVVGGHTVGHGGDTTGLPSGWETAYDNQGRPYYVNYNVSPPSTQYEHPSMYGGAPPPPPAYGGHQHMQQQPTIVVVGGGRNPSTIMTEDEMELYTIYNLGRHIFWWACILLVLSVLTMAIGYASKDNVALLALLTMPGYVCGMVGAKNFQPGLLVCMMCNLVLSIFINVINFFTSTSIIQFILLAINIFCYCYCFRLTLLFYQLLSAMPPQQRERLRQIDRPADRGDPGGAAMPATF